MMRRIVDARGGIIAALALACGVFVFAQTVSLVVAAWSDAPYGDQWQNLISGRTITAGWLFSHHNEHLIAVPRLIFMLDRWLAQERNIIDLAANLAIQAMVAILFACAASAGTRRPWRIGLLGFTLAMTFWSAQWENLTWGFQVGFLGASLAAMATFWLVLAAPSTLLGVAGIMLAMGVATNTIASGVLAALMAPILALAVRRSRTDVAVLAVWAIALVFLYADGFVTHRGDLPPVGVLGFAAFILAEAGGPFGGFLTAFGVDPIGASQITGAAILALAVTFAYKSIRKSSSRAEVFLLVTASFALGSMLLTAYGRACLGIGQSLASRYATPCITFWTSIALLGIATARGHGERYLPLTCALPAVMVLLVLVTQPQYGETALAYAGAKEAAVPSMLSRVDDPTLVRQVMASPEQGYAALEELRAAKTSIFARPQADDLGQPISKLGLTVVGRDCGTVTSADAVGAPPNDGWRLEGTVLPKVHQIILTDGGGTVIGYGGPTAIADRWIGYVPRDSAEIVHPYAILSSGGLCALTASSAATKRTISLAPMPIGIERKGSVDQATIGTTVVLAGWGMVATTSPSNDFRLDTNIPSAIAVIHRVPRPDVVAALVDPRLVDSGFYVVIKPGAGQHMPDTIRTCLWTDDPIFGRNRVPISNRPDLCPSE